MKNYKRKLDNRLGYCIFACQITIATILVVYGLIHQYTHDELVNYIITTKEIIINSMPTIEPTQEQKEPMQLIGESVHPWSFLRIYFCAPIRSLSVSTSVNLRM